MQKVIASLSECTTESLPNPKVFYKVRHNIGIKLGSLTPRGITKLINGENK
jgi:hypothetical protein